MRVRVVAAVLCAAHVAAAETSVPAWSRSPDGKLGVTVFADQDAAEGHHNQVVELATGKVIATLASEPVFEHENHATFEPRWSSDGSLLVWYVDGKWGSFALEVVQLDDAHGKALWQVDVRAAAVKAALAEMKRVAPKKYEAVKAQHRDWGSWYSDGFAIDVRAARPRHLELPLDIGVAMTSNPKEDRDEVTATGEMTARLDRDGSFVPGALRVP